MNFAKSRFAKRFGNTIVSTLILSLLPLASFAQDIEEIVVSVRKSDESLQEVPVAVNVFSQDYIEKQRIETLADVAINTPSLQFDTGFWPSDTRLSIRGLFARAGRPSAAILIDGIDATSESLQTSGGSALLNQRLLNLERIEVARGPQTALFGRAAFSGAVNYTTRRPKAEWGGSAVVDAAEDGRYELRGVLEGPITEDLAFGVLLSHYELDGWYQNQLNGQDVGGGESDGIGFSLNWTPSDKFSAYLNTTYSKDEFDPQAIVVVHSDTLRALDASGNLLANYPGPGCPAGGSCLPVVTGSIKATEQGINLVPDPRTFNVDGVTPNPQNGSNYSGTDDETLRVNLIMDWDLGWGGLRSSTSIVDATNKIALDTTNNYGLLSLSQIQSPSTFPGTLPFPPFTPLGGFAGNYTDAQYKFTFQQYSQEFTLSNGQTAGFQWLAGINAFYEEAKDTNTSALWYRDDSYFACAGGAPCNFADITGFYKTQERTTTSLSAFGLLGFDLTETLKLTLEGRLIYDKVEIEGSTSDELANVLAPPFYTYANSPGFDDKVDDTNFIPRASLEWRAQDSLMFYGSIAEGIKPPTYNSTDISDPTIQRVDPETLWTYEIGTKAQWFENRLTTNAALYYNDYKDQQVRVQFPANSPFGQPRSGTANAGKVSVWGFELDTSWLINENWELGFSYAFTKGEYDDFNVESESSGPVSNTEKVKAGNLQGDYSGNETPGIPRNAFSTYGQYRHALTADIDWYARASWQWQDERWADTANLVTLDSYSLVDGQLGIQTDRWFVAVYGENLFDNDTVRYAQEFIDQTEGIRGDLGFAFPVAYYAYLPQPRTIGIKFNYSTN
jgi:outer membrane receptor protein involved in Fe transport